MNKNTIKSILTAVGIIAFLIVFAWASNEDYKETVIYSMPNEAYMEIYNKLGHGCTDSQIIDEYMENKKYYDSFK